MTYFGRDLLPIVQRKEDEARRRLVWHMRVEAFVKAVIAGSILVSVAYWIGG